MGANWPSPAFIFTFWVLTSLKDTVELSLALRKWGVIKMSSSVVDKNKRQKLAHASFSVLTSHYFLVA